MLGNARRAKLRHLALVSTLKWLRFALANGGARFHVRVVEAPDLYVQFARKDAFRQGCDGFQSHPKGLGHSLGAQQVGKHHWRP